jgi:hypothetical protein
MEQSLKVRVVSNGRTGTLSPKNSTIAELFPEDDDDEYDDTKAGRSKYIYRLPEDPGGAFTMNEGGNSMNNSSKRPKSIDFSSIDAVLAIQEDKETVEDLEFVSIDDLADTIVEVSTDDGSSSDSSDDTDFEAQFEQDMLNNDQQSAESIDSEFLLPSGSGLRRKNSAGLSSPSSSNSLRRKNSGGSIPSPVRKNSANWRESSVLSPAVARLSTEIFPKVEPRPRMSLNRFRNVSRKIHMGVRVGRAVKKIQDLHGMKRINQYLILRALGEGSYGKVKLAEDVNTGKQFAMKVLRKTTARRASRQLSIHSADDTVAEEIAIMKKLNHPNVVKLFEVLETPTTVYLFIEFRPQGPVIDLEKEIQAQEDNATGVVTNPSCPKLALETVRRYVRDIIKGLSYLHAHGVIHQDLKPNNLLLGKDGSVAISDFGISTLISSKSDLVRITNNGTPAFMAPELHGAQSAAHSGQVSNCC